MHVFDTTVRMQHTDAAGLVFFARLFELAHVAYEELLERLGVALPGDLGHAPVILPIVHASADYRAPLRMGDRVRIEVEVREVKSRSFALGYRFVGPGGREAATVATVHVSLDAAAGRATALPEALAAALRAARDA